MLLSIKLIAFIDVLLGLSFVLLYFCLNKQSRYILAPLPILAVLLVPVVGLLAPDKNFLYAYLFLVPFASFGDPRKLVSIYLLMLPQFPDLLQTYNVGSIYLGDFSAIHALNLGAFVAFLFARGPKLRPIGALDIAVWVFFLVCTGFSARGLSATSTIRQTAQVLFTVIPPYYVISRSLRTEQAAVEAMLVVVASAMSNAVIALFEARRSWPLYQQMYYHFHMPPRLSATLAIRSGFLRAQGAIANPATLSLLMGFAIIACLAMRGRFSRAGQWVVLTVLALAMLASQSRGGWIAGAFGVILYLLYTHRTARVFSVVAIGFAGWLTITVALPRAGTIGQFVGRSGDGQMTAEYRSNLLSRGIQEVTRHPWTGQTMDQLQISMNDMRQGEGIIDFVNSHLAVALTLGLFGFAAWLLAWAIPLIVAWRARLPRGVTSSVPVGFPFAMLGALFLGLAFTSTIDRTLPWVTMSFGFIGAFIAINRLKRTTSTEQAPPPLVYTGFSPDLHIA